MLFNSADFLLFFPCTMIIHMFLPQKLKNIWLLVMSYIFYMGWNVKYAWLLFGVTGVSYVNAVLIEKTVGRIRKWVFIIGLGMIIGALIYFKYANMMISTWNRISGSELSLLDIVLPVGISFYMFQAIGYMTDVYRRDITAEKNFLIYALFISFFPQLVAGPIERAENLLSQFHKKYVFNYDKAAEGFIQAGWGFFQKVVIADRIALVVNNVFDSYNTFPGIIRAIAAVCFAIQIYCDFGGYSNIAIGTAKVMGISLMQNFNTPYFSVSVKEFWKRWHISLSGWFRDYVYIPLGGSRCSKKRKYLNNMITMLISGFWHGAEWHYVAWGGVHGLYQAAGDITEKWRERLKIRFHIDPGSAVYTVLSRIITFILVDIAWIFFRSKSFMSALDFIKGMFLDFQIHKAFSPMGIIQAVNISVNDAFIILGGTAVLLWVDMLMKDRDLGACLHRRPFLERWSVYLLLVFSIVIFGYYGYDYAQTQFIYFQF